MYLFSSGWSFSPGSRHRWVGLHTASHLTGTDHPQPRLSDCQRVRLPNEGDFEGRHMRAETLQLHSHISLLAHVFSSHTLHRNYCKKLIKWMDFSTYFPLDLRHWSSENGSKVAIHLPPAMPAPATHPVPSALRSTPQRSSSSWTVSTRFTPSSAAALNLQKTSLWCYLNIHTHHNLVSFLKRFYVKQMMQLFTDKVSSGFSAMDVSFREVPIELLLMMIIRSCSKPITVGSTLV